MAVVRRLQAVVEADGVSDFRAQFDGAKKSLNSFKKAAGGTGAALAVLGGTAIASAVNEARKFESAMVELEKVTNPETASQMSDAIMEMAETIPLAQKELADIAADAGRFGVRGPKNIRSFTESVAKMASATDLSASRAGESLAKLATLTETPIPKVENLGSAINELSNNFATSAGEVVDSMLRASGAMSQFGLSQTEIAGFSAALNAVSESSERAGTRLRRLVQELQNPKKINKFAKALGWGVDRFKAMRKNDPTGLLLKLAEGMKEGGRAAEAINKNLSTTSRQALAGLGQNLDGLNKALDMSAKAFRENTSLQKEFRAASKTLDSRLKILANRARNSAIQLGMKLLPAVKQLVDGIVDASNWISQLNKSLDGMLIPAALASSIIVGLGSSIYFLAGAIGTAQIVAFASGIGIVLAAAAGLTAVIVGLGMAWRNNWFGIRDITMNVVNSITSFIKQLRTEFSDTIAFLKDDVLGFFNTLRTVVKNGLSLITAIWEGDTKKIKQSWGMLMESLRVATKQGIKLLRDVLIYGLSDLIMAATKTFDWFPTEWAMLFADLTNVAVSGLSAILLELLGFKSESKNMWGVTMAAWNNAIKTWWPKVKKQIIQGLKGVAIGLFNALKGAGNRLVTIWKGIWGLFPKPLKQAWLKIKNALLTAWKSVRKTFNQIRNKIFGTSNKIQKDTNKTWNKIRNKIRIVTNFIRNKIINPFMGWMQEQWNKHGKVVLKELKKTVDAWVFQFNRAKKAIMKVINPFLNWAKRTWHDTMWKMKKDAQTIWNGVKKDFNRFMSFLKGILNRFKKDFNTVWNGVQKDFQRFVDWFMGAARSTLDWLAKQWNKHGDEIISIVSFFLDTIKGIVEFGFNAIRSLAVVILRGLRGDTKGVWREIKRFVKSTLNGLKGFLDYWGGKLIQWGRGTFNAAKRQATDAIDGMKRQVSRTVSSLLSGIKREAQSWISNFVSPFQKAKERVIGKFNDLKRTLVGNSIVPDMLGMIMDETGDWKGSFEGEFQAAAFGAEDAMKDMPSEIALPTPGRTGVTRNGKTINNSIRLDVTVPQGVDIDTASRTIADEVKSIGGNNW